MGRMTEMHFEAALLTVVEVRGKSDATHIYPKIYPSGLHRYNIAAQSCGFVKHF